MRSSSVVIAGIFLAGLCICSVHGVFHKTQSSSSSAANVQVIHVPVSEETSSVEQPAQPGVVIQPIFLHKPTHFVRPHRYPAKKCRNPNEVWYKCRSQCALTCANLPKACANTQAFYCESGCDCAYGFARLVEDGPCVPKKKCRDLDGDDEEDSHEPSVPSSPEECDGPNEVYSDCGTTCNEDCTLRQRVCSQQCREGCFCKDGYVRINGVCVSQRFCPEEPQQCTGENEEATARKGYKCEEHCGYEADCTKGRRGTKCFCLEGYKRIAGKCVAETECEATVTDAPVTGAPVTDAPAGNCTGGSVYDPLGKPCLAVCGGVDDCEAEPSCVCPSGQKWLNGKCRAEAECCKLYPNTEWKQGNNCLQTCWPKNNIVCGQKKSYGCFCKAGHCLNAGYCTPTDSLVEV